MPEQPSTSAVAATPAVVPPPFHCMDLERAGDELSSRLHVALSEGVELVVTVGGRPQITLETVEDLEVLHDALVERAGSSPERPSEP